MISGASTEYQILADSPSDVYRGVLLPQGGGNLSEIVGVAYVADQFAAATRATDVVVCAPAAFSVGDLANLTAGLLAASFESGDLGGVYQAMVASSSVLNAPNCSAIVACGPLNRATCPVAGVCGACADGYVGVSAPSNVPCFVAADTCDNGVVDANETDVDCGGACAPCSAANATCALDTDCLYSWCRSYGGCGVPPKSCTNDCSDNGACVHYDTTGARLAAWECGADVWSCSASCVCSAGWYGADCSLDEAAYAEVRHT
jgi:hypothetical protein